MKASTHADSRFKGTADAAEEEALRLESRPSPLLSQLIIGVITGVIGTAVLAAALVHVDQVVAVQGKLVTRRSTQALNTPEPGIVTEVKVEEGDVVKAGQVLVVLDPRERKSEVQELNQKLQAENNRLLSEKQRIKDRVTGLRRQLEIDSSILLPLEQLARQGGAASMDVAEKRRILESTRRELAESEQSLQSLKFESAKLQSETRLQLLNARTRLEQVVIKAPVRGTVLELKAQTGQVAPANETLLKIVPTDDLQAKVFTPSKDLAFIRPGQEAKIGFTAYDPSIYGYLKGNVSRISEDALPPTPEVNFSNFPVAIALKNQFLETKGKRFALQPGMSLTAQIKLQKRSVLQLIFSRFNHGLDAVRTMR